VVNVSKLVENGVSPLPNVLYRRLALGSQRAEILQAKPRTLAEKLIISGDDIEVFLFNGEVP
jgi:hypothetical protein